MDFDQPNEQLFRQSTLVQLRWIAILGQIVTVLIARFGFGFEFDEMAIFIVIGLWALFNLAQQTVFDHQIRLNARNSFIVLLIDLIELAVVLDLSGGLVNPFVTLLIVPVILAATNLDYRPVILLNIAAIIALIWLYLFPQHVQYRGQVMQLPLMLKEGIFAGVIVLMVFLSFFVRRITRETSNMHKALAASELALQREHRLSALGALVAAYAHELGTPLATIRLTAGDLLSTNIKGQARDDVEVILHEAKRTAQILQSMGKRGKADEFVQFTSLRALVEEAATPHLERGKMVQITQSSDGDALMVRRSEAVIQGLRNIIQNAVDFADEAVEIQINASDKIVQIRVMDDGDGFRPDILQEIGEPFLQAQNSIERKGYQGMGLGLFIAKTLLDRSKARVQFSNRPKSENTGAIVSITWQRSDIIASHSATRAALGENLEVAE